MLTKKHSPLQELSLPNKKIRLFIKRDDKLHPHISGNKWRKMKYNIQELQKQKKTTLLTFGGAYSNHIAAVAAAGKEYNFKTIGIIRGEKIEPLNPTLQYATSCGMHLKYISRTDYRNKNNPDFLKDLENEFGDFYALPEGGANCFALEGCREIIEEIDEEINADFYTTACGTGGTISGMITGLKTGKVLGFSALKGDFLQKEVENLLYKCIPPKKSINNNWEINTTYHFGGYAKFKPKLITFMNDFKQKHGILLDPIYTAKMFYGIFHLIDQDYFPARSTIVAVHTGGLQGIDGFNKRFGNIINT